MLHAPISLEFVCTQLSWFCAGTISECQVKLAARLGGVCGRDRARARAR